MSKREEIALRAADSLEAGAAGLTRTYGLIGFDGFVDEIIKVVDKRYSITSFDAIQEIPEFGERIVAAGGKSANFELVVARDPAKDGAKMIKLGGNGPIMANAISHLGLRVHYVGNLGKEVGTLVENTSGEGDELHPVFQPMAEHMEVVSIANAGHTLALEFRDGKLMLGRRESLEDVTWERVKSRNPGLKDALDRATFVAAVNWTMIPFMDGIFEGLVEEALPKAKQANRTFFFDLADPAMRPPTALLNTIQDLKRFNAFGRTILGLNLSEARQVASVLDIPVVEHPNPKDDKNPLVEIEPLAVQIRERLELTCVVVHPTHEAAAATADESGTFKGPYTQTPKITTGAGDHFNAGFCTGQLLGLGVEESLAIGTATSGYYVRNAESPTADKLVEFLRALPEPER